MITIFLLDFCKKLVDYDMSILIISLSELDLKVKD